MRRLKWFIFGVIFSSLFMTTAAFASSTSISAFLGKSVNIIWNGQGYTPTNNGAVAYPIVYNGTIYLPAKSFAEKAGLAVSYDSSSKTLSLSSDPTAGQNTAAASVQQTTKAVQLASIKPYKGALIKTLYPFQGTDTVGYYTGRMYDNCRWCFNLGGKYKKLSFDQFQPDSWPRFYYNAIGIFTDGVELNDKINLSQDSDEGMQHFEVDINNCNTLTIDPHCDGAVLTNMQLTP